MLVKEMEELTRRNYMQKGALNQLEASVARNRQELKQPQFRSIEQLYKNKLIELRTTEMANHDLDKYYQVRSELTSYWSHGEKILKCCRSIGHMQRRISSDAVLLATRRELSQVLPFYSSHGENILKCGRSIGHSERIISSADVLFVTRREYSQVLPFY